MAEPKELPMFQCALAELLEAGVSTDMRPAVEFMCDDPANLGECFTQLPAAAQEQLSGFLPVDDRGDPRLLRHPALAETLGLFRESLSRISTAPLLRQWRNRRWTPAVDEPCEGRYRAAVDGKEHRPHWFPAMVVNVDGAHVRLRYDDDDEEETVPRQFVRPATPCAAPAAAASAAAAGRRAQPPRGAPAAPR